MFANVCSITKWRPKVAIGGHRQPWAHLFREFLHQKGSSIRYFVQESHSQIMSHNPPPSPAAQPSIWRCRCLVPDSGTIGTGEDHAASSTGVLARPVWLVVAVAVESLEQSSGKASSRAIRLSVSILQFTSVHIPFLANYDGSQNP